MGKESFKNDLQKVMTLVGVRIGKQQVCRLNVKRQEGAVKNHLGGDTEGAGKKYRDSGTPKEKGKGFSFALKGEEIRTSQHPEFCRKESGLTC